jgi:hypothetical protein
MKHKKMKKEDKVLTYELLGLSIVKKIAEK